MNLDFSTWSYNLDNIKEYNVYYKQITYKYYLPLDGAKVSKRTPVSSFHLFSIKKKKFVKFNERFINY